MRAVIAILFLAASALALSESQHWANFKTQYGRRYSSLEEARRYVIFKENLLRAENLNLQDDGATYGITQFSDLTSEEFIALHTGLNRTLNRQWHESLPEFPYQKKMNTVGSDQSDKSTSVKNQGSCGSCWAFSATAAAEGCNGVKGKKLVDLSPQQIMDCCNLNGCDGGCNGGMEYTALEWAAKTNLATLSSYPYQSKKQTCKDVKEIGLAANTCKFYRLNKDESSIAGGLEHNTITIALDATQLQLYSSGVLSKCSGTSLNHALLLVSDVADGDSYKIKNSWGTSWGENGYFRMVKGRGCLGINLDYHSIVY